MIKQGNAERFASGALISLVECGPLPLMDEDSACSLPTSHPLQPGEYQPDPGSGDWWLNLAHGLPGGTRPSRDGDTEDLL